MTFTREQISDRTGFDNEMRFDNADEVRAYFTIDALVQMGLTPDFDAEDFDADDFAYDLSMMADEVIEHGWHMIGEVIRLNDTTVQVVTGHYGACDITTIEAYVEDRWEDEDEDVPAEDRYRLGVLYECKTHMPGGGISNTQTDYDPYPSLHPTRPTAEDVATLSREMADDLAELADLSREQALRVQGWSA